MNKQILPLREYFPETEQELEFISEEELTNLLTGLRFKVIAKNSGHHYPIGCILTTCPDTVVRVGDPGAKTIRFNRLSNLDGNKLPERIDFKDISPDSINKRFIEYTKPFLLKRASYFMKAVHFIDELEVSCVDDNTIIHLEELRIKKVLRLIKEKKGMTDMEAVSLIRGLYSSEELTGRSEESREFPYIAERRDEATEVHAEENEEMIIERREERG